MKILQLIDDSHIMFDPNTGGFMGGLAKAAYDVHDLIRHKYESTLNCGKTDLNFSIPGMEYLGLTNKNRVKADRLLQYVKTTKPDVIIIHSSAKLANVLSNNDIRYIYIEHLGGEKLHKLIHESLYTKILNKNKSNGGLNITVSQYNIDMKHKSAEEYWPGVFVGFDGFLKFQFLNDELSGEIVEGNGKLITVGRAENTKNPHVIRNIANIYKLDFEACVAITDNPKSKSYFDEHIKHDCRFKVNLDRSQVMSILKSASVYLSTFRFESAGITAFESLCYGVPLILNSKNGIHASTFFDPEGEGESWVYYDNKKDISETIKRFMSYTFEDRKRISDRVRNYNSKEAFIGSIDQLISNYQLNQWGEELNLFTF